MEPFERSEPRGERRYHPSGSESSEIALFPKSKKRLRTPQIYRVCEPLTEAVIYFMAVFAPWAFGTTQTWTIWTMNIGGYFLGVLLLAKKLACWETGFEPSRWGMQEPESSVDQRRLAFDRWLTRGLAGLTFLVLLYCLIGVLNARATFHGGKAPPEYHDFIAWLPHSYDRISSWQAFWQYLALACLFWATRDWLLGKTRAERFESGDSNRSRSGDALSIALTEHPAGGRSEAPSISPIGSSAGPASRQILPTRLRRLLWVLCVNGALVALEGILQRLDGAGKLLWMVEPRFNKNAEAQFGPYAYRANAATFYNLIWPVCLGFWLNLRHGVLRAARVGRRVGMGSYVLLLPCAVLMAASPVISTTRGGALVSLAGIIISTVLLLFSTRREVPIVRALMLSIIIVILLFAGYLGWKQLADRLENLFVDQMSNRSEIYENALPIARDFPVFGAGPGTFGTIYQLYREPKQEWAAYVHDDWLETRITLGWVGLSLIVLMLIIVWFRWFVPTGIPTRWEFVSFLWLSLAGCLFHAKFDFPFQIYSIDALFISLCAVLFSVSRK